MVADSPRFRVVKRPAIARPEEKQLVGRAASAALAGKAAAVRSEREGATTGTTSHLDICLKCKMYTTCARIRQHGGCGPHAICATCSYGCAVVRRGTCHGQFVCPACNTKLGTRRRAFDSPTPGRSPWPQGTAAGCSPTPGRSPRPGRSPSPGHSLGGAGGTAGPAAVGSSWTLPVASAEPAPSTSVSHRRHREPRRSARREPQHAAAAEVLRLVAVALAEPEAVDASLRAERRRLRSKSPDPLRASEERVRIRLRGKSPPSHAYSWRPCLPTPPPGTMQQLAAVLQAAKDVVAAGRSRPAVLERESLIRTRFRSRAALLEREPLILTLPPAGLHQRSATADRVPRGASVLRRERARSRSRSERRRS